MSNVMRTCFLLCRLKQVFIPKENIPVFGLGGNDNPHERIVFHFYHLTASPNFCMCQVWRYKYLVACSHNIKFIYVTTFFAKIQHFGQTTNIKLKKLLRPSCLFAYYLAQNVLKPTAKYEIQLMFT